MNNSLENTLSEDSTGHRSSEQDEIIRSVVRPKIFLISGPKGAGKQEISNFVRKDGYAEVIKEYTTRHPLTTSTLPFSIDEDALFDFVSEKEFNRLRQHTLAFEIEEGGDAYGISSESVEKSFESKTLHAISMASGFDSFKQHSRFFETIDWKGQKPEVINVLLYASEQDLSDKRYEKEESVTAEMRKEMITETRKYVRNIHRFDYAINNPTPFGYKLDALLSQHVEDINTSARVLEQIIKVEHSPLLRERLPIEDKNSRYVKSLVSNIFGKGFPMVMEELKKKPVRIHFPTQIVREYAEATQKYSSMVPNDVAVRDIKKHFGIWTVYISSELNPTQREMVLDLIERKADGVYAHRVKQQDLLNSKQNVTVLGRAQTNAGIYDGGLFTLRDVPAKDSRSKAFGLNIAFVHGIPRKFVSKACADTGSYLNEDQYYPYKSL